MKDMLMWGNKWISVFKSAKGYFFAERAGKDSIAILPFRTSETGKKEVLVRLQPLVFNQGTRLRMKTGYEGLPVDELIRCPITGSLDGKYQDLDGYVIEEMKEEAGYNITFKEIVPLGFYYVGTQTNEVVHCFTCDVTGKKQVKPEGDGSYWEYISKNEWHGIDDLLNNVSNIRYSGLVILLYKVVKFLHKTTDNILVNTLSKIQFEWYNMEDKHYSTLDKHIKMHEKQMDDESGKEGHRCGLRRLVKTLEKLGQIINKHRWLKFKNNIP